MTDAEIKRFWVAHDAIFTGSAKGAALEDCAQVMVDYAMKSYERDAWAFVFARFSDFIERDECPPRAFLTAFNDAFRIFRSGKAVSLDEAFLGKRTRKRPPNGIVEHGWAETNASLVEFFLKQPKVPKKRIRGELSLLDAAIDKVQTFRKSATGKLPPGNSAAQIKRQRSRFKK